MLKKIGILGVVVILLINFNKLYAGNHEVIHPTEGYPIGWGDPGAVPYWMDRGPLGVLSNIQAKVLTESMMDTWASVGTALVDFSYRGDLPEDVTKDNIADYLARTTCGDSNRTDIPANVVPIVFDSDGGIIEYLVGIGSSIEVGGLATLRCFVGSLDDPKSIYQGMLIINGQFIDGKGASESSPADISVNGIAGVMLHELGHLIGLDHTALNEEIYNNIYSGAISRDNSKYLPVMLPTVLRNSNSSTTLHPDDISAISILYPRGDYLSTAGNIKGEILTKNGKEVRKVNVIARREDDPLCEAVSAVTGRMCTPLLDPSGHPNFNSTYCDSPELFGDYIIEGLIPGSYTVEVEELADGWIRDGMYPSGVDAELPGDAEFYNNQEQWNESPYLATLVGVAANETVGGINIILSDLQAKGGQLIRLPLSGFDEGPGTRCVADPVDYAGIITEMGGEGDFSASLGEGTEETSANSGSDGGCQLNRASNRGLEMIFIFILVGLCVLIRAYKYQRQHDRRLFCFSIVGGHAPTPTRTYTTILIIIILLISSTATASSIIPTDLDGMSHKAGKIFHGRCIGVDIIKDENGLVSTLVTYEVLRGVKGVATPTVTFKIFGVATKDVEGSAQSTLVGVGDFSPGREDVLFLYQESPWGFTAPIGLWQGEFPVMQTDEGPRLSQKSRSYQTTIGSGVKAAVSAEKKISTPDSLLDEVEEILGFWIFSL